MEKRIKIFCSFGELLRAEISAPSPEFTDVMQRAENKFPFFISANIVRSLNAVAAWLTEENLNSWLRAYPALCGNFTDKKIAIIMAGNIPFVGFHDVLCVLMAGYKAILRQSSNDPYLWKYLLRILERVSPEIAARAEITDGLLREFDAVIATGSNNSARYFEEYFAYVPHLIRKNRSSVAVLHGEESETDLDGLYDDIFSYFGLGCRNVSHIFLPAGYDVQGLALRRENGVSGKLKPHNAYMHNYEYSRTLALMNNTPHIDTEYCLWVKNSALCSPTAVIYYSFYDNLQQVEKYILEHKDEIQCVAGNAPLQLPAPLSAVKFGAVQSPAIIEYADGIDTMQFCSKIINFTTVTA
jgi:hypothetical protein